MKALTELHMVTNTGGLQWTPTVMNELLVQLVGNYRGFVVAAALADLERAVPRGQDFDLEKALGVLLTASARGQLETLGHSVTCHSGFCARKERCCGVER
jgi:hypothetical protein